MYLTKVEHMNKQFLFKLSLTTFIIFNLLNICYIFEDYGFGKLAFSRSVSVILFCFIVWYFARKKKTLALIFLFVYLLTGIIQYIAIFISLFV